MALVAEPAPAAEVNIAPTGIASQSSTAGADAARAIDGRTDGNYFNGSVTHTDPADTAPWWQVDLGEEYTLLRIVLWNRTDCCAARLTNFRVSVLDDLGGEVHGEDFFTDGIGYPDPALGGFEIALPAGTSGQVARIDALGPNQFDAPLGTIAILSLAEVQVFVDGTAIPPTITQQPRSGRVYAGKPFVFSVGLLDATGVTFQWKKGASPIPGETSDTLTFCKTKVTDTGTYTVTATRGAESVTSDPATLVVVDGNLAPSGTASQSSTGWGGDASRAIDGNTDGVYGNNSVTHTAQDDPAPWWEVQLLGDSAIETIILWNRTDDCQPNPPCDSRLSNFRVSILDSDRQEVHGEDFFTDGLGYPDTRTEGFEIPVEPSATGRYVRVDILGPNSFWGPNMYVSLAEVEVFGTGPKAPPDPDIARGRIATQSSTHPAPYPAGLAVDGSFSNFTHTLTDDDAATWQVDLCDMTDIEEIVLYNRVDCCGSRLRDITVSILDSSGASVFDSELLNAENVEGGGQPGVGPPTITVDLQEAADGPVKGRFVRVSRTPDPDLSGSAGQGSGGVFPVDEANVLSLAEVEVFALAVCPPQGDTHCTGLLVEGPSEGGPGTYTLTASATDDSGDLVLYYTFKLDDGVNPPIVIGPQKEGTVTRLVPVGTWTATVEVDDNLRCPDAASDAICTEVIEASGDPNNLALKGTATQSTTANNGVASRAIDGITDGNFFGGSVTHTDAADAATWWQVDLGGTFQLEKVVLWNRVDCCSARLTNFHVAVLDEVGAEVHGEDFFTDGIGYPDPLLGGFEIPLSAGTSGRVVRIDLLGPNQFDLPLGTLAILSLAEVEVYRGSGGGTQFRRGDADAKGGVPNITDGIYVLNYLFLGGAEPPCMEAADADNKGGVNITDGIYILNYLFQGGPAPPAPGPDSCGPDTDVPGSPGDLGCDSYPSC